MSAATIERPSVVGSTSGVGSSGSTRTRRLRRGRGAGRGTGPVSRSTSGVAAPQLRSGRKVRAEVSGCSPEFSRSTATAVVSESAAAGWRLTNRGIAVILIAGAVLVAAAITVIAATAVTVTSDSYHPHGSALSHR